MRAAEFDRRFEAGEDITEAVNWEKAKRPNTDDQKADSQLPVENPRTGR
ncbi:hypothetical protein ACVII0_003163 [Sinorhizobium meliloti]|nr:hypothetical protein [Sinorhizobium meliloti]